MENLFVIHNQESGIHTVTINNPDNLNALNGKIIKTLKEVFAKIKDDDSVKVVILTGSGRAFVAGADIAEMADMDPVQGMAFGEMGSKLFKEIEEFPVPVIAAINGFALGGGCELALACDIRVASDKAKFGQPEVSLGITPGFSGTVRLARIVGESVAKELIFTGKIIDSQEAERVGLVNHVYPHEIFMDKVKEIAAQIASKAPIAVRFSKQSINGMASLISESSIKYENTLFGLCFSTHDQKEGMRAFLEKRAAEFKNR